MMRVHSAKSVDLITTDEGWTPDSIKKAVGISLAGIAGVGLAVATGGLIVVCAGVNFYIFILLLLLLF
jgi:hypothetical protein